MKTIYLHDTLWSLNSQIEEISVILYNTCILKTRVGVILSEQVSMAPIMLTGLNRQCRYLWCPLPEQLIKHKVVSCKHVNVYFSSLTSLSEVQTKLNQDSVFLSIKRWPVSI